jgi:hypothetical protein
MELERYWATVAGNLARGRLRLLFVADRIPPELQSVIEFLTPVGRDVSPRVVADIHGLTPRSRASSSP